MLNFNIKYLKFFLTSIFISFFLLQCKGDLSNALKDTHEELTEKEIKITVSQSPLTTESGGSETISIVMTGPPVSPVTIPVVSSNTAEGTVDKNPIIFDKTNWNAAQAITVAGVNDDIDDDDQVYSVQVGPTQSNDPNFNNITFQNINFTNQDDDTAGFAVSASNNTINVAENGSSDSYTIVLTSEPTADVTISISNGAQIQSSISNITFTPGNWNAPQGITFTAVNDNLYEANHSDTINHVINTTDAKYSDLTISDITANITDNDPMPTVSFASTGQNSGGIESGNMSIQVSLSQASGLDVTVPFSVNAASTGTGGSVDYTLSMTSVTINAGSITANITLTINSDLLDENPETVILDLGSPTNATLGAITSHTATIDDDDPLSDISITNATVIENDSNTSATFTVTLSQASGKTVSVDYTTANVSAVAGSDYTATAGTLIFNPGETSKNIIVDVIGDILEEVDEFYQVQLSNPANGNILGATGSGQILDNDRDGPKIQNAQYLDTDSNGRIDHVRITFDEDVLDSSFDGFDTSGAPSDQEHNTTAVWSVAGYVNIRMDTRDVINSVTGDTGSNDNVIWLAFDETGSGYDTGSKPNLTASDSSLTDSTTGICFIQTDNALCSDQSQADLNVSDVVETDKALPIIVSVTGISGSDRLDVTFSEQVDITADGTCSSSLTEAAFQYNDDSTGDNSGLSIASTWLDPDGCDGNIVAATSVPLTTSDINVDTIQAATATSVYDNADNSMSTNPAAITGAISPYVLSVVSNSATTLRVTFSEPVDSAQATILANYSIVEVFDPLGCTDINLSGTVTQIDTAGIIYELSTGTQCSTTVYRLTVIGIIEDKDEGVPMVDPKLGEFLGAESLKIVSASCLDLNNIKFVFSKDVLSGSGSGGAEASTRYSYKGIGSLGSINSITIGPGNNEITINHSDIQDGSVYTLIGSNGMDSDGFDDSGFGAIRDSTDSEDLQNYPNDRALFTGCGQKSLSLDDDKPFFVNPFGDGVNHTFLARHKERIILGTDKLGISLIQSEISGNNISIINFSLPKDTSGGRTSSNADSTNPGPPFISIGNSSCTADSNAFYTACGPDNENGIGQIFSGALGGQEYLFMHGTRSTAGDFDYIYYTTDSDQLFNFNYINLNDLTSTTIKSLNSAAIQNDRLYLGFAKEQSLPGEGDIPEFSRVNFSTSSTEGDCTPGTDCEAWNGTFGYIGKINWMPYFGGASTGPDNDFPNWAWIVGVDAIFVFNDMIYMANGGHHQTDHNGSIIRSTGPDPAACTANNICEWAEIAPRTNTAWYNSDQRYSLELTKTYEITPEDKAFPHFAEFEGNLFVIRNACNIAASGTVFDAGPHTTTGCTDGSFTNREPQLWKCDPGLSGTASDCDSNDWSLIDDSGDGITNFGDTGSHTATMLIQNGSRLYIGFNNENGIQVYRTKSGITDPALETDFEQVGSAGLGFDSGATEPNLKIFSAISIKDGVDSYLFISTGTNSSYVKVYRQKD